MAMAPLSCLQLQHSDSQSLLPQLGPNHPVFAPSLSAPLRSGSSITVGFRKFQKLRSFSCCCLRNDNQNQDSGISNQEDQFDDTRTRREALFQTAFAAFSLPAIFSLAAAAVAADADVPKDFRLYSDDANKYKIMIPQDWQVGAGENNGIKSVTAFVPQEPSSSNVSVVITGLGADFTRVESFGKVDAFAESLVGGLDRSWQRPPGVAAKLLDCKAANGLYYIEYTLQNPGGSRRHLISVLGVANNGWYNRLYTVTGQVSLANCNLHYLDEESEKYGPKIEKAVASFRLI